MSEPIDSFSGEWSFLSNFFRSNVWPQWWPHTLPPFPTVEHAFQACKVEPGQGANIWLMQVEVIRSVSSPGRAKRLGRRVMLRPNWEEIKIGTMFFLLDQKFRDESFCHLLLCTGERELIEGNKWGDTFWGVCDGEGENHLGRLLMEIRADRRG